VLGGQDIICCMATGGGKSAIFAVPIIILREMARNPRSYPDLPVRQLPLGIVIAPTKGLAASIVRRNLLSYSYMNSNPRFMSLRNSAVLLLHIVKILSPSTEARKAGRNLVRNIAVCKTWNVICVDPEHLREKAWRDITASEIFQANIVYGCVDEVHLINEWGVEFRPQFKHICSFFRGRLPSSASIMALSATLQSGAPSKNVCTSLGMLRDDYYVLRTSNERPNVQIIMEPLENGVGGKVSQLIPTTCEV
ncbi:hypothetical protein B0H19DRAFT_949358, partial [Mycena capillaripes]